MLRELVDRLANVDRVLHAAQAFAAVTPPSRTNWHDFITNLDLAGQFPGIKNIGYTRYVTAAEKHEFSTRRKLETPGMTVETTEDYDNYAILTYREPEEVGKVGVDLFRLPARLSALLQSRDSGRMTATPITTLVSQPALGQSVVFYLPVYGAGEVPPTIEQRRQAITGWISVALKVNDFLAGVVPDSEDMGVHVFDGERISPETLLYDSDPGSDMDTRENFDISSPLVRIEVREIADRQWTFVFKEVQPTHTVLPDVVLGSGVLISLLVMGLSISLARGRNAALVESERRFKGAFDVAPNGIALLSTEQKFLKVNASLCTLLGYAEDILLATDFPSLLHPEDRDETTARIRELLVGRMEVCSLEGRFRHREGRIVWGAVGFSLDRDGKGRPLHIVWQIQDITEKIVAYNKELEAKRQMAAAMFAADRANKAKSEFLSNMSHEIRTPMNAVIGMHHLLQRTDLDDRQRDYLNKASNAARSLLTVINDILDFSKIEAGKLQLEAIEFKLGTVLANIADIASGVIGKKSVEIVSIVQLDVPACLIGDPSRLGQVLLNLVNNAIKFTAEGVITTFVSIATETADSVELRFSVRDTGIGMTPAQMEKLFKAFNQADNSTTRVFGGTGLGLSISKQLVEKMDGRIDVTSTPAVGSEFFFTARFGLPPERRSFVVPVDRLSGWSVLVVEDLAQVRNHLREILTRFGMIVRTAETGTAALDEIAASRTDLILLDRRLSEGDRVETIRNLRNHSPTRAIPVLLMAPASEESAAREEIEALALSGLLLKPILPERLLEAVLSALEMDTRKAGRGPDQQQQQNRLAGRHILLVEDLEINQEIANAILTAEGATVRMAEDGVAAIATLEASPEFFDLVLMDLHMPVMDGFEATRRIRANPVFAELPVIAMTASALDHERQKCLETGMNDHIAKPIQVEQTMATICRWLKPLSRESSPMEPATPVAPASPEKTPAVTAMGPLDLPGFDIPTARLRVNGNDILLRRLLIAFANRNSDTAQGLRAALDASDIDAAYALVHAVKGSSGNLAATELYKSAEAFQVVLSNRDREKFEAHFTLFKQRLEETIAVIHRLDMASHPDEMSPVITTSPIEATEKEDILKSCHDLAEMMKARSMRSVAAAEALGMRLHGHGYDAETRALEEALTTLNFKAGRAVIQDLIDRLG
ncbi:MAG: response regulator [Alphaproteobacteria bacterium]